MNKKEYLTRLKAYLQGLPSGDLEDILSDYEEHFNIGISKGKSEEEISKELGDPREVAHSYRPSMGPDSPGDSFPSHKGRTNNRFLVVLLGFILVILSLTFSSLSPFVRYNSFDGKFGNIIDINSKDSRVRIGADGIEVKDGDDHVVIGWRGIKVTDGADEVDIGWDGIKIKEANKSGFKLRPNWGSLGLVPNNLKWEGVNEERFIEMTGFNKVSIASSVIDIKVTSHNSGDLRINYFGEMKTNGLPKLLVEERGEKLLIKLESPKNLKNHILAEADVALEIFIPKNYGGDIGVTNSSGDIYMKDLVANKFEAASSSGDLRLENLEGDLFSLVTSSGDMRLKNLVGKLDLGSSSGSIYIANERTSENIKVSTSSGDVFFTLPKEANYSIRGRTSSGNIYPSKDMDLIENNRGIFRANIGSGEKAIDASTSSGDINFN